MIQPASLEELASLVEKDGKKVFLFVADWCGDCRYIYPALPEIEETNPEFTFIRVDRDQYMDCLLYTSPSPRDVEESRMPSSA